MNLFVTTTGTDVAIPELGFTLVHPTVDYDMAAQFTAEEIRHATSLTAAIRGDVLQWRSSISDPYKQGQHYDEDLVEVSELNTGDGIKKDRLVTFGDLKYDTAQYKSGTIIQSEFSGSPKKYQVVFGTAFGDNNYSITISSSDGRNWTFESRAASGFIINSNANQALTGVVTWDAIHNGESVL